MSCQRKSTGASLIASLGNLNIRLIAPYKLDGIQGAKITELEEFLKNANFFSIDTETTGLDPHLDKVIMLQIGDESVQYIVDTRYISVNSILKYLEDESKVKVGTNVGFDYKMLLGNFSVRLHSITDIFLQELVIQGGKRNMKASLGELTARYLKYTPRESLFGTYTKETRLSFLEMKDEPFTLEQVVYGALDIVIPIKINRKQKKIIKEYELENCIKIENKFTEVLAEIEFNGFYLDKEKWMILASKNKSRAMWYKHLLQTTLLQYDLYDKYGDINWNSSKQVISLFKEIGINTQILDTKKSRELDQEVYKDTVQKYHIQKYAKEHPIVEYYIKYKLYHKAWSTYGEKFLRHINPVTGRVHSSFWQIKNTGRVSSSNPNLQNIPSIEEFRFCFVPQKPDYTLVVADYSSQEGRIMADISRDKTMINFFNNGDGDLHSFTAKKMFGDKFKGKKESPDLRFKAKILNFSIAYGVSAYKLSKDFNISTKEAQQLIDSWLNAYPGLKIFFEKSKKKTLENGYVLIDNVTNRRFYLPDYDIYKQYEYLINRYHSYNWKVPKKWYSWYYYLKGKYERISQNYPIQGTAASMTKVACIRTYEEIRRKNLFEEIKMVNIVHDEIILETKFPELSKEILEKSGKDAGKVFCVYVDIEIEPKITKKWTH